MSEWDRFTETILGTIKGVRDALVTRIEALEKSQPLRGERGEKGDRGEPGEVGPIGISIVGPVGEKGERGEKGIDGKDGAPADLSVIEAMQADIKAMRAELLLYKSQPVTPDLFAVEALVASAVAKLPVPRDGRDGKDIDPVVVDAMVQGAVSHAMKAIPVPQNGKDGTSVSVTDLAPLVKSEVATAVSAIPVPKDGRSVTVDDVSPLIERLIENVVAKIQMPKDGVGIKAMHLNIDGHLVASFSDGRVEDLGRVTGAAGQDGLPGVPGRWGDKGADGRDGLNGKDGLGVADFAVVFEPAKGWFARWKNLDREIEQPLGVPFDAGVWKAGHYPQGAAVTRRGSLFIAQKATAAPPDEATPDSRDWRLAVKSGRDGKHGKDGRDGNNG